ncbi:nucleotidyltransferase domain-containing protein [Sphingomonas asaccharolytica]|uniref:nucleotidyltransferase domain-containing protein n=1 Tax=Sphingomonas asaccharolytica TaxID=40681 RepID=UPI0008379D76|nr:nucleotidyltransferase family protein [Sphingomonas asaccharolytica]
MGLALDGRLLARALADPASVATLDSAGWQALLTMARAELLSATLAHRLDGIAKPAAAQRFLDDAKASCAQGRLVALWEVEMARRALGDLGVPVVLLKGSAFIAAGLAAGQGRFVGDLDILVPRAELDRVEAALLGAGWEWVKPDPYDDAYYRRWMHELPPLIHRVRDRMIDVHHTILPPTARPTPDADALIADSIALPNGLHMLNSDDMICHAAAHLFADGDLSGGMRNLWDIHRLVDDFGIAGLAERARRHGLAPAVRRALRLSHALYDTQLRDGWARSGSDDDLYLRRLTARDGWGRQTRPVTRLGFYVRSHWLRMPPLMLARHLWTKWRKQAG